MTSTFDQARVAHEAGRLDEAESLFRAALSEEPAKAANELGTMLFALGRDDEARSLFLSALAAAPDWAKPRFNLGLVFLARGDCELGWLLHEARRKIPESGPRELPLPYPEWRGGGLKERRVVVLGEQGFGDQIMFARFLPELQARGAATRYFCGAEVAPLFEGATATLNDEDSADYWVFAASLPARFGTTLQTLPPPLAPALPAGSVGGSGGRIGVMARGRAAYGNDANRSLHGAAVERLLALGRDLSPESTGARDFLDTARIIADLDLVISVDTAVAHLAASMGKPTWILLPAVGCDWRWLRGRTDSPWYPSARLFRQSAIDGSRGDWTGTLDAVEAALRG